tara:strand:+ start:1222 stop:1350 length:129 start_codon:yes stop_codon:yes gene_type:complete
MNIRIIAITMPKINTIANNKIGSAGLDSGLSTYTGFSLPKAV